MHVNHQLSIYRKSNKYTLQAIINRTITSTVLTPSESIANSDSELTEFAVIRTLVNRSNTLALPYHSPTLWYTNECYTMLVQVSFLLLTSHWQLNRWRSYLYNNTPKYNNYSFYKFNRGGLYLAKENPWHLFKVELP